MPSQGNMCPATSREPDTLWQLHLKIRQMDIIQNVTSARVTTRNLVHCSVLPPLCNMHPSPGKGTWYIAVSCNLDVACVNAMT